VAPPESNTQGIRRRLTDFTDGVDFALGGQRRRAGVARRRAVGGEQAFELQQVDAIFSFREFAHALDHELWQLAR
jgi:hypothetical protein